MRVAVYGTLKQGYWNHSVMIEAGGKLIGKGITLDKGWLFDVGFPFWVPEFVIEHPVWFTKETKPKHLLVEVYEVDDIKPLDRLEGYPSFYNRYVRPIILVEQIDKNKFRKLDIIDDVWIYVPNRVDSDLGELISNKNEQTIQNASLVDVNNFEQKLDLTFWGDNI